MFDENIALDAEILIFWNVKRKKLKFHLKFKSDILAKLNNVSIIIV